MENNDKLNFIRQKCIEANPNRSEGWDEDSGRPTGSGYMDFMPCRLADVLLVIKKMYMNGTLQKEGEFKNGTEWFGEIAWDWNLRSDDLTQQSEETINFLFDLLQ